MTGPHAEKGRPVHATTLSEIARRMREDGVRYGDAVRVFQTRFIEQLLYVHAGRLGKVAKELRVHPNTLTRLVRTLAIDVARIRSLARTTINPEYLAVPQTGDRPSGSASSDRPNQGCPSVEADCIHGEQDREYQ